MRLFGARVDPDVAHVAQLVEHILGKDEVSGSIPLVGSTASDDYYHKHVIKKQ